jgi:hypothetical protein
MIVTSVHPLQVIDEPIPEAEHDFSVDLIVTCVIGIIGQRGGHQGAGVADDHAGQPNPSSSRSSGRHVRRTALPGGEPSRRPGLALDRAKVAAHVIEHRWHMGEIVRVAPRLAPEDRKGARTETWYPF